MMLQTTSSLSILLKNKAKSELKPRLVSGRQVGSEWELDFVFLLFNLAFHLLTAYIGC